VRAGEGRAPRPADEREQAAGVRRLSEPRRRRGPTPRAPRARDRVRPGRGHALLLLPRALPGLRPSRQAPMSAGECAGDAIFRGSLPECFSRRVFRLAPGLELALEPGLLPDTVIVVEQGELELECRAGTCRRFARGSLIPIALLPVSRLRSV